MKASLSILCAAVILTACANVPMAPVDSDSQAKAFSPPNGKASLYIYRNETFGAAIPISVGINGRNLGQTAAQTYYLLNLTPGLYDVDSRSENMSKISVSLEPNKNYFVWQEIKMGLWTARSQLQQVDEQTGKKGVMESKRAAPELNESDLLPLKSIK